MQARSLDSQASPRPSKTAILTTALLLATVPLAGAGIPVPDPGDHADPPPVESGWHQEAKLEDPTPEPADLFGTEVAIDGDVMVVGHPWEDNESLSPESNHGALTVFERDGQSGEWTAVATFEGDEHGSWFGSNIALDGDRFVTSAPGAQGGDWSACELYVYEKVEGDWQRTATLAPDIDATDNDCALGGSNYPLAHAWRALDLDGNLLVAGLPEIVDGGSGPQYPGEVLVYRENSTGWHLEANFTQPVDPDTHTFGQSVAISEESQRIAVANTTNKVFLFEHGDDGWTHARTFTTLPFNAKGVAMSADGQTIATRGIPMPRADSPMHGVEVFEETDDGWTHTVLRPMDEVDSELAINGLAIDGDRLVAGTPYDDRSTGKAAGPLGRLHLPCSLADCTQGSAYVFEKAEGSWEQVAKLTPDDGEGPYLGWAADVSGDTVVAGAPFDDGDRRIEPDPSTPPIGAPNDVGAAYTFTLQQGLMDEAPEVVP